MSKQISLLFVCLGNICRSPMAEGIFLHLADSKGVSDRFLVDSCGLGGWHVGERADPRARATAMKFGVDLPSRARQFEPRKDLKRFDLFLAMDKSNMEGLVESGVPAENVRLIRSFDPANAHLLDEKGNPKPDARLDVPDPYYGGNHGFEQVYEMLVRACDGLIDSLI